MSAPSVDEVIQILVATVECCNLVILSKPTQLLIFFVHVFKPSYARFNTQIWLIVWQFAENKLYLHIKP